MGPKVMMNELRSGMDFLRKGVSFTRLPDGTRQSDGSEVNALCTQDGGYGSEDRKDFGRLYFIDLNEEVNYARGGGISVEIQVMGERT